MSFLLWLQFVLKLWKRWGSCSFLGQDQKGLQKTGLWIVAWPSQSLFTAIWFDFWKGNADWGIAKKLWISFGGYIINRKIAWIKKASKSWRRQIGLRKIEDHK